MARVLSQAGRGTMKSDAFKEVGPVANLGAAIVRQYQRGVVFRRSLLDQVLTGTETLNSQIKDTSTGEGEAGRAAAPLPAWDTP